MQNTPEQDEIIAFAKTEKQSLMVKALAGTGKTTTLVKIMHALPLQPTLCLAFNKAIATEMQKRMPSHVSATTINSLGHRAWARAIGKSRLAPETGKNYELVKEAIDSLPKDLQGQARGIFSSLMKGLSIAKSAGFVPRSMRNLGKTLVADEDIFDIIAPMIEDEPDALYEQLFIACLEKSIRLAYEGNIDFDDQVYMTTLFQAELPKFPIVGVDEAQDLSPLNHFLLDRLKPGRLIAIGDPLQSIYAFRGADTASMDKLKARFNMKELTLSVSFRVPKAGVERARFRAPHFKYFDGAQEGTIVTLQEWGSADIPDGAMIICRANAPLFACAIKLIKSGRGVTIKGKDIGPGLIKVLKKLGPPDTKKGELIALIKRWEDDGLKKARESRKSSISDRADCLRVFAEYGNTLAEAIAYAEHLFSSAGPIQLTTGHKAKGLEEDVVFHLNPWMIPSKYALEAADAGDERQLEQELNLRYVIETRFKREMYLVDLEKMQ